MKNILISLCALSPGISFATPTPLSPRYEANCQRPQWSPDGSKISYEVNYHDRKVIEQYLITATGSVEAVTPTSRGSSSLTAGFSTSGTESVIHELTFSPSALGTYIYSASGSDSDYDLYLQGGTRLAASPGADGGPTWSPSGNHVAFTSARTGQGDVYLLNVADLSQPPTRLTSDATSSELYVAWSPNGESLAFVGHNNIGDNIWIIDNIANPGQRALTNWARTQTRPSFSPDGRHVAFYSNREEINRFDLYVSPVNGTPRKLYSGVVMNENGPVWMPDSTELLFVADQDDQYDPVYRTDLSGSSSRINTGTVGNGDMDVAALGDGNVYLAITAQGTTNGNNRDFKQLYVVPIP